LTNRKIQPSEQIVENGIATENTRRIINNVIDIKQGDEDISPQITRINSVSDIVNPQKDVFYLLGLALVYWDGNQWLKSQDFTPV
tara:strand:+ start:659 stop:913 length:255 start_codon:yes stop_codon:yes gene_type:complete